MKALKSLETTRTFLRHLSVEDAESFYQLNLDPEVLQFTGDKAFVSIEEARVFLANYHPYEKYNVGRLAVINKANQEFIGWSGLKYSPDTDEYDIGFRFLKAYWHQGFATETAQKCIEYGFEVLGISKIVGRAMAANTASVKVLEKLGMTFKGYFDFDGQEGVLFEIRK